MKNYCLWFMNYELWVITYYKDIYTAHIMRKDIDDSQTDESAILWRYTWQPGNKINNDL